MGSQRFGALVPKTVARGSVAKAFQDGGLPDGLLGIAECPLQEHPGAVLSSEGVAAARRLALVADAFLAHRISGAPEHVPEHAEHGGGEDGIDHAVRTGLRPAGSEALPPAGFER